MRGTVLDIAYVAVIIVVFAIGTIIGSLILTNISNEATNQDIIDVDIINAGAQSFQVLDALYIVFVIGALMGTVVSAFFLNTHPIFFIASLFTLILLMLLAPILTNIGIDTLNSTALVNESNKFPTIILILENLPMILVAFMAMLSIVLFAKSSSGGSA